MGPYNPAEPLAQPIEKLKKGREFAQSGVQTISDAMIVSKGVTILEQTVFFKKDIQEWRRQTTNQKTLSHYKLFLHQAN